MDQSLAGFAAAHQHIEAHLQALEQLTQKRDAKSARAVLDYFSTAGAQHHRDEDEDLFPLLRGLAAARERPDIAAIIGVLEREHVTMELQWSRLRPVLDALASGGGGPLEAGEVSRFAWLHRRHMDEEATVLLPFAKETLTAEQWASLRHRMAARRALT